MTTTLAKGDLNSMKPPGDDASDAIPSSMQQSSAEPNKPAAVVQLTTKAHQVCAEPQCSCSIPIDGDSAKLFATHVIVGFGMAGMHLYRRLRERGEQVIVLERRADFRQRGYALHLQPQIAKLFDMPLPTQQKRNICFQDLPIRIPASFNLLRSEVVDQMALAIADVDLRDVRFGCAVKAIDLEQKVLHVLPTGGTEPLTVGFDFLHGCDGANSVVRECCFNYTRKPSVRSLRLLITDHPLAAGMMDGHIFYGHRCYAMVNQPAVGVINVSVQGPGSFECAVARPSKLAPDATPELKAAFVLALFEEKGLPDEFLSLLKAGRITEVKLFNDDEHSIHYDNRYDAALRCGVRLIGDAANGIGAVTGFNANLAICDAELTLCSSDAEWKRRQKSITRIGSLSWIKRAVGIFNPTLGVRFRCLSSIANFVIILTHHIMASRRAKPLLDPSRVV